MIPSISNQASPSHWILHAHNQRQSNLGQFKKTRSGGEDKQFELFFLKKQWNFIIITKQCIIKPIPVLVWWYACLKQIIKQYSLLTIFWGWNWFQGAEIRKHRKQTRYKKDNLYCGSTLVEISREKNQSDPWFPQNRT